MREGLPRSASSHPVCRSQTLLDLAEVGILINGQGSSGRPSPPGLGLLAPGGLLTSIRVLCTGHGSASPVLCVRLHK